MKQIVHKIEISHRTIIFTVVFLLLLWLLYQLRNIVVTLFVGIILVSALNPGVERLERLRIPRFLAAIILYLIFFLFLGLLLVGIVPSLVSQTQTLISRLPSYFEWIENEKIVKSQLEGFLGEISAISFDLIRLIASIFGNLLSFFVLIFVSFYLLLERRNFDQYCIKLFGRERGKIIIKLFKKIETRLGEWVRAQVLLMIIVGLMSYLGLRLLGIEYALPLSLIAGLLEVVPNIGPVIAAIPAILAGLVVSPLTGVATLALYFLVQQLENHIIVPQVMKRGVGINPLVTILALIAGFKLGGTGGAILAIPLMIVVETILKEGCLFEKTYSLRSS